MLRKGLDEVLGKVVVVKTGVRKIGVGTYVQELALGLMLSIRCNQHSKPCLNQRLFTFLCCLVIKKQVDKARSIL